MRRIAFTVGITAFTVFLISAWMSQTALFLCAIGGLLLLLTVLSVPSFSKRAAVSTVLLTTVLCVFFLVAWNELHFATASEWDGKTVEIQAQVTELFDTEYGQGAILTVQQGDLPAKQKVVAFNETLHRYDVVQARISVQLSKEEGLALLQSKARGAFLYVDRVFEWKVSLPEKLPWYAIFERAGDVMAQKIRQWLPNEEGALVSAVCLGRKEFLSAQTEENFRCAGLSHLLALSGLHLSVLSQALYRFLKTLGLARRIGSVITICGVWIFVLLAGPSASLLRAAVMISVALVGRTMLLQADGLNSLGLALTALTLINPYAVYDAGFLLSFGATFGILTVYPFLQRTVMKRIFSLQQPEGGWKRYAVGGLKGICAAIGISLSATVVTLPITVLFFGSVSTVVLLSNLLAVTAMSFAVSIGFVATALLCLPILCYAAPLLLFPLVCLCKYSLSVAEWTASFRFSQIFITDVRYVVLFIALPFVCAVAYKCGKKRGWAFALATLFVVTAGAVAVQAPQIKENIYITAPYAGKDTVVLIEADAETVLLLSLQQKTTLSTVTELLEKRNLSRLDKVVLLGESTLYRQAALLKAWTAQTQVFCTESNASARQVAAEKGCAVQTVSVQPDTLVNGVQLGVSQKWVYLFFGKECLYIGAQTGSLQQLPQQWQAPGRVLLRAAGCATRNGEIGSEQSVRLTVRGQQIRSVKYGI